MKLWWLRIDSLTLPNPLHFGDIMNFPNTLHLGEVMQSILAVKMHQNAETSKYVFKQFSGDTPWSPFAWAGQPLAKPHPAQPHHFRLLDTTVPRSLEYVVAYYI